MSTDNGNLPQRFKETIAAHNLLQKNLRRELEHVELRIRRLEDELSGFEDTDNWKTLLSLREIAATLQVLQGEVKPVDIFWTMDLPF